MRHEREYYRHVSRELRRERRHERRLVRMELQSEMRTSQSGPAAGIFGCAGLMAAAFVFLFLLRASAGPVMVLPLFFPIVVMAIVIGSVLRAAGRSAQERVYTSFQTPQAVMPPEAPPTRADLERKILEAAARNDGWVTPAQAVIRTAGLTVAQARQILDELAKDGMCTIDSDDEGTVYYRFPMGRPRREKAELSAKEWVDDMVKRRGPASEVTRPRRMTGDQTQDGDELLDDEVTRR